MINFILSRDEHEKSFITSRPGLHCWLRQNRSSAKEIEYFLFFEIITCEPSIYTMDHPDITVSNFMGNA